MCLEARAGWGPKPGRPWVPCPIGQPTSDSPDNRCGRAFVSDQTALGVSHLPIQLQSLASHSSALTLVLSSAWHLYFRKASLGGLVTQCARE